MPPDRPAGANPPTSDRPEDPERDSTVRDLLTEERATANAIYGIIVSSGVMASADSSSVVKLAAAVLVTLLVYWAAERFAHVMGQRIVHSPELTAGQLRQHLGTGWELVSASFLPLGVLLGSGLLGASVDRAVVAALICATLLLFAAGWRVGREAALSPSARLLSALCSGAFGVVMIALKALLH